MERAGLEPATSGLQSAPGVKAGRHESRVSPERRESPKSRLPGTLSGRESPGAVSFPFPMRRRLGEAAVSML